MNHLKIKEISEKEIWIGDNRTVLMGENIIYVTALGEQTTEIANAQVEFIDKLSTTISGKISYLIDLNKCGKNSPEARAIWKQFAERESTRKVAIYGLNPVARVIASFVIGISKSNKERFFLTKEEAQKWLSE